MNSEDLGQLERLCERMFTSQDNRDRTAAQQQLAGIGDSLDSLGQLRFVLENSGNPYALMFASQSLLQLLTKSWNAFTDAQRVELEEFLFHYIGSRGPSLETYLVNSLVQVLSRLTKLGWYVTEQLKALPGQVTTQFIGDYTSLPHVLIGLNILTTIVHEVNTPTSKRTLTQHRKIAVSFRDLALLDIFQVSVGTLSRALQISGGSSEWGRIRSQALQLALQCLVFDFVGVVQEESNDDCITIQVPTSWRAVIQDTSTVDIFWAIYQSSNPQSEEAKNALACVVQFVSIRRSIFSDGKARGVYMGQIMSGIVNIFDSSHGIMENGENYHEFCRLLFRMKTNYQLSELVEQPRYREWVEKLAMFTLNSVSLQSQDLNNILPRISESAAEASIVVQQPQSIYYLLNLWSRLCSSTSYLKTPGKESRMEEFAPQIMKTYINTIVSLRSLYLRNGDLYEDPLENHESFVETLELLPPIVRIGYDDISKYICSMFDSILQNTFSNYRDMQQVLLQTQNGRSLSSLMKEYAVASSQLAVLVYTVGVIVAYRGSSSSADKYDAVDAEMASRCIQTMRILDAQHESINRLPENMRPILHSETLELALLSFFQQFRKVYIGESAMANTQVYTKMSELVGLKDHIAVLDLLVQKLLANLMRFGSPDPTGDVRVNTHRSHILRISLTVMDELSSGYSSGKQLLRLEALKAILNNVEPGPSYLNALNQCIWSGYGRDRSKFYGILAKLLFMDTESETRFHEFMSPMSRLAQFLDSMTVSMGGGSSSNLAGVASHNSLSNRSTPVSHGSGVGLDGLGMMDVSVWNQLENRRLVLRWLRCIRGVVESSLNRRTYALFFDWMFPAHMPLLIRLVSIYGQTALPSTDPIVINTALKLVRDFVNNKSQRITFDCCSPNGILLFKKTSEIIVVASRLLQMAVESIPPTPCDDASIPQVHSTSSVSGSAPGSPVPTPANADGSTSQLDRYQRVLKPAATCIDILWRSLSGGYCNFGVFQLYNDTALTDALQSVIRIAVAIPLNEISSHVKLRKAFYSLIEVLSSVHISAISELEPQMWKYIITALEVGIQSLDANISCQCCAAIDHLCTYFFKQSQAVDKTQFDRIRYQITQSPDALPRILSILVNTILYDDCPNQWSLSRPLLSLIVTNADVFSTIKQQTAASVGEDRREKLMQSFEKLMKDVEFNLEPKNRDKFSQNLTLFRHDIKNYL